jgi:hypothetical protein
VCPWTVIRFSLISICVMFMWSMVWSMATTIALLFLSVASITNENALFRFWLTHVLLSVIRVVKSFFVACCRLWVFNKLTNDTSWWWVLLEKSSRFTTFTRIETVSLPLFAICSFVT